MCRILKTFSMGLAVALLAACASTPQQRFASSVKAAQNANRPVVIYGFGNWVARNGNIENGIFRSPEFGARQVLAVINSPEFGATQVLAVINTAAQPIQKLAFKIEYYNKDRPALGQDGKPIVWTVIAKGPLSPGSSHVVQGYVPQRIVQDRLASGCPHLVGIQGEYTDGSTFEVDSHNASRYLTPQINVNCVRYPTYSPGYDGAPVMPLANGNYGPMKPAELVRSGFPPNQGGGR